MSNETLQQPFVQAGTASLAQQMGLLGLNGTAQQQTAIDALLTSPQYTSAVGQGEDAILQNAAATGGLRGGNTQNSLARFRSDLLSSTINDQLARLGNVSALGQNAAAGVGNAGQAAASNIGNLLQQQGAAVAGGQIAKGNAASLGFGQLVGIGGALLSSGVLGGGGAAAKLATGSAAPGVSGF